MKRIKVKAGHYEDRDVAWFQFDLSGYQVMKLITGTRLEELRQRVEDILNRELLQR